MSSAILVLLIYNIETCRATDFVQILVKNENSAQLFCYLNILHFDLK